jgi:hypothetical protein
MMSMPILPNVPVQPSLHIGNGENQPHYPTNMPPPAPTDVPLGERSVNVVRAAVTTAARTLTPRRHDEQQQPMIKSRIIEMLKRNPKISWEALELAIDRWCSASKIRRCVTSL